MTVSTLKESNRKFRETPRVRRRLKVKDKVNETCTSRRGGKTDSLERSGKFRTKSRWGGSGWEETPGDRQDPGGEWVRHL